MKAMIEDFLNYLSVERGLAKNTIASYRMDLAKFTDFLGKAGFSSFDRVKRSDITDFLMSRKDKNLSATTLSRNLVAVKMLFRFLARERLIREDVAGVIESPKTWKKLPDALSLDEVEALITAPDLKGWQGIRDRAFLELLYATGMRVSEAANVQLKDLNMDLGFIKCMGKGQKVDRVLESRWQIVEREERSAQKSHRHDDDACKKDHVIVRSSQKRRKHS